MRSIKTSFWKELVVLAGQGNTQYMTKIQLRVLHSTHTAFYPFPTLLTILGRPPYTHTMVE